MGTESMGVYYIISPPKADTLVVALGSPGEAAVKWNS